MEPDLADALRAYQGGAFPEERLRELVHRLRTDSAFREAFGDAVWILGLSRLAQAPEPRWTGLCEEMGWLNPGSAAGDPRGENPGAVEGFENLDRVLGEVRREPAPYVRAWWRRAAVLALAACLVLLAGLGWMWGGRQPDAAGGGLGDVVSAEGAVWENRSIRVGSEVRVGPLKLLRGNASIGFHSGVLLFVEGPADLEFRDSSRIWCGRGRLRLRVPPGAEGFVIDTPEGVVTDLGTELGVEIAPGRSTRLAVYEGKAEASLRVPGQGGVRTEVLGEKQGAELVGAQGVIRRMPIEELQGVGRIPMPGLRLAPGYREQVLEAGPVFYWRLDRVEGDQVAGETEGTPVLWKKGAVDFVEDTAGTRSAWFRGGALAVGEAVDFPGEKYAVECWLCAEPMSSGGVLGLAEDDRFQRHFGYVEFTNRLAGSGHGQASALRFLHRRPAGGGGGMNVLVPQPGLAYRWHHWVVQQDSGRLEVYQDGKRVGRAEAGSDPGGAGAPCWIQLGALRENLAGTKRMKNGSVLPVLERPFLGRMAEMAIYSRPLSEQEIRRHAQSRLP